NEESPALPSRLRQAGDCGSARPSVAWSVQGRRETSPEFRLELPQLLSERRRPQRLPPSAQHLAHDRLILLTNRPAFTKLSGRVGRSEPLQSRGQLLAQVVCEPDSRHAGVDVDRHRQTNDPTPARRRPKHREPTRRLTVDRPSMLVYAPGWAQHPLVFVGE